MAEYSEYDFECLDGAEDMLIDNGWFIVPEYTVKDCKFKIKTLNDFVWRTYSIHPPLELLN